MPEINVLHEPRDDFSRRVTDLADAMHAVRKKALDNGAALGSCTLDSHLRSINNIKGELAERPELDASEILGPAVSEWHLSVQQDWEINDRVIRDMDAAALDLSAFSRVEYLEHVPRMVGEICGFQKVLFSVVQGTHWIPVSMWAKDPGEVTAIRLNKYLKETPVIRLVGSLPEADMARHRRPVLIENALQNPHTAKRPIALSNATDYAGAPLFVHGKISAFIHMDRAIQTRPPNETDMLWLYRFSNSIAAMYEIQVSSRRESRLRSEIARIGSSLDESADPDSLAVRSSPGRHQPRSPETSAPKSISSLSAREYEVLEALSLGLTNQAIATKLSVSIHTVRTHVRQILKKMRVNHRAAAVAVFTSIQREHSNG